MKRLQAELSEAHESALATTAAVKLAHRTAVNSGGEFAQLYLLDLIGEAARLDAKLQSAMEAARRNSMPVTD